MVKYLGLRVDQNLNWKTHIKTLKHQILIFLRKFFYLKTTCPKFILKQLYFAFVHSKLQYGLPIWGSTYISNLTPIVNVQKSFVRIICNKSRHTHSFPLFLSLQILPLRHLYVFKVLDLFYKISNNFGVTLDYNNSKKYLTRGVAQKMITLPKSHNTLFQKTFVFLGPKFFNYLPLELKTENKPNRMKSKFKKWLFTLTPLELENIFSILS